jgi:uncharacterized Zn finger protein
MTDKPTCPQCGGTDFTAITVTEMRKVLKRCAKCGRESNPSDLVGSRLKAMQNILKAKTA